MGKFGKFPFCGGIGGGGRCWNWRRGGSRTFST